MTSQVYFLSVVYLIINGMFLLLYRYRGQGDFIQSLRNRFYNDRSLEMGLVLSGFIICIGTLAWPTDPGPAFLGDALVAINILMLSIQNLYFYIQRGQETKQLSELARIAYYWYGIFTIALGCLHFLFPYIVLI